MARFYAQICTVAFLIVGIGGWFVGDASHMVHGHAQGNVDGMMVHLTYARDLLDVGLLLAFVYVGFVASRRAGRLVMGAIGVVLLALAAIGFAIGDTTAGTRSLGGLHFTMALNIFDLVVGVLAVLTALGTVEDQGPTSVIRPEGQPARQRQAGPRRGDAG